MLAESSLARKSENRHNFELSKTLRFVITFAYGGSTFGAPGIHGHIFGLPGASGSSWGTLSGAH